MPTWTLPKTWLTGEALTASDMNTHIRDNLDYVKDRADYLEARVDATPDEYTLNESADYTTTSSTYVDVDATDLAITITTTKPNANVLVHFDGVVEMSPGSAHHIFFDVDVDGSPLGGDDGLISTTHINTNTATARRSIAFTRLITGLSEGSHTFKLQWKMTGASAAKLFAGAGTSNADVHPQFWAKEV